MQHIAHKRNIDGKRLYFNSSYGHNFV
jgi:hypothetical protein